LNILKQLICSWSVDWWNVVNPSQFGGVPATRYDVRQWYCSPVPQFLIGVIKVGNIGSQMYFAASSNPWIMSECDVKDNLGNVLEDTDTDCAKISKQVPVTRQCCGFCILSQAHLMRMWNCTDLSDPVSNPFAIQVLSLYCTVTLHCSDTRPCLGDPVKMGDPNKLFDPSRYTIGCDQLDSGCKPDGKCNYRWACDNSIESLRQRIGYYAPSTASSSAADSLAALISLLLSMYLASR
jgi:hypothetical protein